MSDSNDAWESSSLEKADEDERGGFSEHELLDIMYNACNRANTGEVLASTIVHYLHSMTAQSPGQDRLLSLGRLLDPECQDRHVSRETFHACMTEWISQCSQESTDVESSYVACPSSSAPVHPVHSSLSGLDILTSQSQTGTSESQPQCSCEDKDLLATVAELKYAHHRLNEQNSSLLKTVAHCEDTNLQLSLEITELRAKLASSQRSAARTRSLTEELEETRRAFKEAQERASRTQASCSKLSNEVESLRVHIRRLEDKNEKLTLERTYWEDSVNKLVKVHAELRAELDETLVVLMLREREVTKRDMLMDMMKCSHRESHSMIEGLQSELMRLQEHSQQVLLRYDRHCTSPQTPYSRDVPNHRSLQSEMQDVQQSHHRAADDWGLPAVHAHSDDIRSIIHRIKSAEILHRLQAKLSEREPAAVETPERPLPLQQQQQQARIKRRLVNVLQELELNKCAWEEKGEKVEEQRSAGEQKEQKHNQTGSQAAVQEARKAAVVNLWKACSADGAKSQFKASQTNLELSETQAKLQKAEQTIRDMRKQVSHLQASLISAQSSDKQTSEHSGSIGVDKETNTDAGGAGQEKPLEQRDVRDVAVATEAVGEAAAGSEQPQVSADGLLATLRRMEAMVSGALETAELVKQSEQRVSQVTGRMESIAQRVEEALGRAANTEEQLDLLLECRIAQQEDSQSPGLLSADPGTYATRLTEDQEGTENHPPPPPEGTQALPMNGGPGQSSCTKLQEEREEEAEEEQKEEAEEEAKDLGRGSPLGQSGPCSSESCDSPRPADQPFFFPHTRSRPSLPPAMPTLPEEEEDSPEELDSSSSSPSTPAPAESRAIVMPAPTIIYPQQAAVAQQGGRPLEQNRPHSPRSRLARSSCGGPITTVDSTGNVIDLVKDPLPELQLSEEDRQKNLELLEQAKKVSDRFLTRRGRRSTGSLSESPTALSPLTSPIPSSSPSSSRSSSVTIVPQPGSTEAIHANLQPAVQHLELTSVREQHDATSLEQQGNRLLLADWKPAEKRKVSSGTLAPRYAVQKENFDPALPKSPPAVAKGDGGAGQGRNSNQAPATGVAKPVPRPPTQQAPCTAEIKTIGAFPPLMRAVSWDAVGSLNSRNGAPGFPPTPEETDKAGDNVFKPSGYKDLASPPGSLHKLSKLKDEHKMMRNQTMASSKLPELSEAAEQEKGLAPFTKSSSSGGGEEAREKSDAMPNISDVMLRKLKLHRGLPGCAPPLTEKEVENAFVQLSLAFRNDNYTLEMRIKQAERERNLTEEDTEKELEEFKGSLKLSSPHWQNMEQREAYQRLIETVSVLRRLATRLSSRAEIVGAVRQEKRMSKATEVMMQYVENLKRTYEKDHAELMEFKKLANQNSNRCYGGAAETGDDGVSRPSRSMSLTLGKALPRRRVSVAVVPKFNLLNIPGQSPTTAVPGPGQAPSAGPSAGAALPVLNEANDTKVNVPTETPTPTAEGGKSVTEQESEPAKPHVDLEKIRAEIKAKIEEEAYNKGFQEGLKQSKVLQEKRLEEEEEEENTAEKLLELKNKDEESGKKINKSRRMEEFLVLLIRCCPRVTLSRRLLLVALTLFVVMCLVISIFTFFSDRYNRRDDT